jgi:hypothetical protein
MMDWKQNGYLLCPKVMVKQQEKDQQLDGQMKEDLLKVGLTLTLTLPHTQFTGDCDTSIILPPPRKYTILLVYTFKIHWTCDGRWVKFYPLIIMR